MKVGPTASPQRDRQRAGRSRWAAVGAAVAICLGGGTLTSSASVGSGVRSVYVPITPCRLLDTRPGADSVGTRSTPVAAGETFTAAARGSNGKCTIPSDAIGLSMNVAIVNPTASSFLTVFPAGAERPLAASLNWVAGQDPTPNAVVSSLSADGRLSFYNLAGTVDLAVDVVGYYADHDHDDRYPTKQQVDSSIAAGVAPLSSSLTSIGNRVSTLEGEQLDQRLDTLEGLGLGSVDGRIDALEAMHPTDVQVASFVPSLINQLDAFATDFTSAHDGKWQISAYIDASITCDTFNIDRLAFVVVDGVAQPSGVIYVDDGTPIRQTIVATTLSDIPAGTHSVRLGTMCQSGGASTGGSFRVPSWTVVVLP